MSSYLYPDRRANTAPLCELIAKLPRSGPGHASGGSSLKKCYRPILARADILSNKLVFCANIAVENGSRAGSVGSARWREMLIYPGCWIGAEKAGDELKDVRQAT